MFYQNKCKRDRVQDEVGGLVVRVEAGEEEENDGDDRQELPGRRVLQTVVQLLPVGQTTYGTWKKVSLALRNLDMTFWIVFLVPIWQTRLQRTF